MSSLPDFPSGTLEQDTHPAGYSVKKVVYLRVMSFNKATLIGMIIKKEIEHRSCSSIIQV